MIDRFRSGGLPRPRFSGSIGNKSFKMRHSASVKSPLLKPTSKKQPRIKEESRRQRCIDILMTAFLIQLQGVFSCFLQCYRDNMTEDARQSLIALGSVTLFIGFFVVSLSLLKGIDIPNWVLPLGLVMMTVDFVWRFFRWTRAKRAASDETPM